MASGSGKQWQGRWLLAASCCFLLQLAAAAEPAPAAPPEVDVRALVQGGRYAEAEILARSQLAARDQPPGTASLAVADALDDLVRALYHVNKAASDEARASADRSLRIRTQLFGADDARRAQAFDSQTLCAVARGDLQAASALNAQSLALRSRALAPDDLALATSLHMQGVLALQRDDMPLARDAFGQALAIREHHQAADHPELLNERSGLAAVAFQLGDYRASHAQMQQVVRAHEATLGPDSPALAYDYQNLGIVLSRLGRYIDAEVQLNNALRLSTLAGGPDNPDSAVTLDALALVAVRLGDADTAIARYQRALALLERASSTDTRDLGTTLNNLAVQLLEAHRYAAALPLLERALALVASNGTAASGTALQYRSNYANVIGALGQHARADRLFEQQLAELQAMPARDPFQYATTWEVYGMEALNRGDARAALQRLTRARAEMRRLFDDSHPYVARVTAGLAQAALSSGQYARALSLALAAERVSLANLRLNARTLPERAALAYADARVYALPTATAAAQRQARPEVDALWDAVIAGRAVVLDELLERNRVQGGAADRLRGEWSEASADYSRSLLEARGTPASRAELAGARDRMERSERAFAEASAEFRAQLARRQVDLARIRAGLPADAALVAFRRVEPGSAGATTRTHGHPDPGSYIAFVLAPGNHAGARLFALGAADTIDAAVESWRAEVRHAPGPGSDGDSLRQHGATLRGLVWDPLKSMLAGAQRVFVVADGALLTVNFAALPEGEGFLVERGPTLHLLNDERELARPPEATGRGLLAMGAPTIAPGQFTQRPAIPPVRLASASMSAVRERGAGYCRRLDPTRFTPLPGADAELEAITAVWREQVPGEPAQLRRGTDADEATIKRDAIGRRVVHLATHGFLRDPCAGDSASVSTRGVALSDAPRVSAPTASEAGVLDLAGLVLAGDDDGKAGGASDGILSAAEVATLNLQGVEWAVLSACETGIGLVGTVEGVFGLRRAFRQAGARTQIISLWSVNDLATRDWMRLLYEARLREHLDTAESVRAATLRLLQARRAAGESTHPYYWGAFVATGDWR